ncbi:MAG: hypothetical protein MK108_01910 [Mariniblastus sp.]|nr:hypothetical protein [Mariniblastus sp.]
MNSAKKIRMQWSLALPLCLPLCLTLCLSVSPALLVGFQGNAPSGSAAQEPLPIGTQRELFVDPYLIESMDGARLQLHHPQAAEPAIPFDKPWEGAFAGYATVIKDGDLYRAYYRGLPRAGADGSDVEVTCCAVSADGIHWKKPDLDLYDWNGVKPNNIVLMGETPASHNFAPFLDRNPAAPADQRYKALGGTETSGLIAYVSADGFRWRRLQEEPVFRQGVFDSQNVPFWSEAEQQYVCYFRTWTGGGYRGFRTVSRTTSPDFIQWSDPQVIDFGDAPQEHLYTNQMTPYFRAPHIYLGLAARFMPGRRVITSGDAERIQVVKRYSNDCSDTVLISSRGGNLVDRQFLESFVRPGPGEENWVSRSNYAARGIVPTGEHEMSLYLCRNYGQPTAFLQRYRLRTDGLVSVHAGYTGGEMRTRLIEFPNASAAERSAKRDLWRQEILAGYPFPLAAADQPIRGTGSMRVDLPVAVPLPGTRELGDEFTLAAQVRDVPGGHRRLFSAYNGGSSVPGELIFDFNAAGPIEDGNALRFLWDDFELSVSHAALGDWSAESGDQGPHHLAVTWQKGLAKIYFDGRLVAEKREADARPVRLALGDLRLGEDYPPTPTDNEPFRGVIDDVLVLPRALSEQDIAHMASEGPAKLVDPETDRGVLLDFEPGGVETTADLGQRLANRIGSAVTLQPGIEMAERHLSINMATSAAGSIRVEIQKPDGSPYPGFSLADSDEMIGDRIEQTVSWSGRSDLSELANQPIRLRFVLRDADLYSLQFK